MGHFSSIFSGLARSLSFRIGLNSGKEDGRETAAALIKEAKKTDLVLRSSGYVNVEGSRNFVSCFSKRGEKGVNQDCFIVLEEFGCQADMSFCGIFDEHGSWGHFVAKKVRESMPSSLVFFWQQTVAQTSLLGLDTDESDKKHEGFNIWKHSYTKACAAVDQELLNCQKFNSFCSGTTALTIVRYEGGSLPSSSKQGIRDLMYIGNVGDSRAVLATTSHDGSLVSVQLTVDFKPNLPQEAERISQCNGRLFCLPDEPGVHRVWLPDSESPGLAMSRAFGDYCVKDFGLVSVPEVTERCITICDQFVVLATNGVWDVVSNQEAVEIVSSTLDKAKSAKRLVHYAAQAWKRKRWGIAKDDISAICLFFRSSTLPD